MESDAGARNTHRGKTLQKDPFFLDAKMPDNGFIRSTSGTMAKGRKD